MKTIVVLVALIMLLSAVANASDWQWPDQMTIGGFRITDIRGSVGSDGVGSATGAVSIPSMGTTRVNLTRSARGEIAGSFSLDTRRVRGSFKLSERGIQGSGTVECPPKSIDSSSVEITPRGDTKGSGRVSLGRLSAAVDFNVSASSCSMDGSVPVKVQADTAVASYIFNGVLALAGGGGRMSGSVTGSVERTGKLTNQVTSFNIPKTSVDLNNGQCTINIGGVSVVFTVF